MMDVLFFHGRYCPACADTREAVQKWAASAGASFYAFDVQDPYAGFAQRTRNKIKHVPCTLLIENGEELARVDGGADFTRISETFKPYITKAEEETNGECFDE